MKKLLLAIPVLLAGVAVGIISLVVYALLLAFIDTCIMPIEHVPSWTVQVIFLLSTIIAGYLCYKDISKT